MANGQENSMNDSESGIIQKILIDHQILISLAANQTTNIDSGANKILFLDQPN